MLRCAYRHNGRELDLRDPLTGQAWLYHYYEAEFSHDETLAPVATSAHA